MRRKKPRSAAEVVRAKPQTPPPRQESFKVNFKFKTKKQKELYNAILDNKITFVRGGAGVGKTIVALAAALEIIQDSNFKIDQLVLSKPVVEATSGKGLGFLPGDAKEKSEIHYMHFYDNLTKLVGPQGCKFLKESSVIKEVIINYVRGITLGHHDSNGNPIGVIALLDESQNCTANEMKTFISRMGEGTKLVVMGDSDQIDIKLQKGEKNGLDDAIDRFYDLDNVAIVEFTEDDIVRDKFLIEIMKRYKYD